LYPLCREIDEAAETRLRTIPDREQAHEIILAKLVYNLESSKMSVPHSIHFGFQQLRPILDLLKTPYSGCLDCPTIEPIDKTGGILNAGNITVRGFNNRNVV
jgi:hypothetical protein